MGFMAGFGNSFANSFESAQQRKAVKERDAFQVAYQSAMDRKKEYDAAKAEDEKIITHISNFRPVKRITDVIKIFNIIKKKTRP